MKRKIKKCATGYQLTKVGIIPNDWIVTSTIHCFDRVTNKVAIKQKQNYTQIGIRSHAKGIFIKQAVTGEQIGNKRIFWIEKDCFIVNIVFAWEQAVAKTTVNEEGLVASHRFPMYKPKDNKLDLDYILYFFKSKRGKHLLGLASPGGAGRNKTLGQKEFSELKLPLPSYEEQNKIVKIISTWDKAISIQQHLIQQKQNLKKGLMQKLLSADIRFKEFNEDWEEVKLGNIATINTGSSNREDSNLESEFTFFDRSQDVRTSNKYLFDGEVIIVGGEGREFIPKYYNGKFDLHQRTYAIMNFVKTYGKFIFYKITQNKQYFSAFAVGSTVKSLRMPIFIKMKLNIPNIKEQKKIAQVLSLADKEIELLQQHLQQLLQQKQGLMQKLLTGEVRVKVQGDKSQAGQSL